jgi:hypothetical protein
MNAFAFIDDPVAYVESLRPVDKPQFDRIMADHLKARTIDDPAWRIDNLYWIQDAYGKEIKFVRNEPQRRWWNERWFLNIVLKARQLGFSTEIALEILDECLFIPNFRAGIIDYSLDDAKKKLDKIRFAYARLSPRIRNARPLVRENTETIEFANGSRIEVGTSHRGGTLQHLHVSEFGKTSAARPDKAKEIKTGAFGTVHVGQRIDVESTAEGRGGEFYEMVQRADALKKEGRQLSQLDFKLHFFAWWQHRGYRLDPRDVRIPVEVDEYVSELRAKHGIRLDDGQVAWYAAKRYQIGPDNILREYPSFPEEAFQASIEGAYFKRQMAKARLDGRICHLPHDDGKLVNTFWDIGNDTTAIWFHQTDGVRHRFIDYYENSDESITHYVHDLKDRKQRFGWTYGTHFGPHDLAVTEWGGSGKNRANIAAEAGVKFKIIPRIEDKDDAIDVARQFLAMCWFDQKHCEQGVRCLDNYRKKWNEQLGTWSREPMHDWASHGSDAMMTGAMGYRPPAPPKPKAGQIPIIEASRNSGGGADWLRGRG